MAFSTASAIFVVPFYVQQDFYNELNTLLQRAKKRKIGT